jgi:hypothetical protein
MGKAHRGGSSEQLRTDLERNRKATEGLASAIEAAGLPVNAILLKRVREREVQRQAILAEIAGLERKRYLGLLVEEIRVEGQTAVMRGSEAALAQAVSAAGEGIPGPVPRFGPGWLPKQGEFDLADLPPWIGPPGMLFMPAPNASAGSGREVSKGTARTAGAGGR